MVCRFSFLQKGKTAALIVVQLAWNNYEGLYNFEKSFGFVQIRVPFVKAYGPIFV